MEKYLVLATFAGSVIALIFAFVTGKKVLSFDEGTPLMSKISQSIRAGANAYLKRQYTVVGVFFACMIVVLCIMAALKLLTWFVPFAFLTGGFFSGLSGFVGMRIAGIGGVLLCSLGCIIPSFVICFILAYFYYKYRTVGGVQTVLSALRPAVVALITSAGTSILMLALFQTDIFSASLKDIRFVELGIFLVALFLLRKFKMNAITIILGSGVVGTLIYMLLGMV